MPYLRKVSLAAMLACTLHLGAASAEQWNGVKVGAFVGLGNGSSQVNANTVPLTGDALGARGPLAGVMTGYDMRLAPQFLLGAQLESEFTEVETTLDAPSVNTTGSARKEFGLNLSLRGGFLPSEDTLVYAIGGYSRARYRVEATSGASAFSQSEDFDGYHLGFGMETRLSGNASLRLEYRHERYEEKTFGPSTLLVGVKPQGNSGRITLVWNFDDAARAIPEAAVRDWSGVFFGLQAGYGGHTTDLALGSDHLKGVGGSGYQVGFFTGYDHHFGTRTVVGIEGGMELSGADFDSTIGTTSTHAEMTHAVQASARAGVLLQPATLLYARAGWMRGFFKGASGTSSAKETSDGVLAGVGLETQLGGNVSLRMEYRHVQFSGKDVAGMNIEPSLQTGSIGLAYKF